MYRFTHITVLCVLICGTIFNVSASLNVVSGVACGKSAVRTGKIKGGDTAMEGEYPWMVSVRFGKGLDSHHVCGGSLIHSQFVVTAAHCMLNKSIKWHNVMIGEHNREAQSSHETIHAIKKIYIHEDFQRGYVNDIALLELKTPVKWSKYVRPICLPETSDDAGAKSLDSQKMTVAGWGYTDEKSNGGKEPMALLKAIVPIVDYQTCQKWYDAETKVSPSSPSYVKIYNDKHLCAGMETGEKDSCRGDSGGPLMKSDGKGRKSLIGIVSAGSGCGRPKVPGIYTRTVSYVPWILSILKSSGVN
ncbi:UNVERIFIED_CONTAM: hypothetical protein RMT77_001873 [Armadillidium vulgare]